METLVATSQNMSHNQDLMGNGLYVAQRQGAGPLIVLACGRSLTLYDSTTVDDLQAKLQHELGIKDQTFEVYDCDGARIFTDYDLQVACNKGKTPFTATLSDSSIHTIENRREELAQMQWKLIRDGQHSLQVKLDTVLRNVQNLEVNLAVETHDRVAAIDRLKSEFAAAMEQNRADVRLETRSLEEQVAGVSNLLSTERNVREVGNQRVKSDIQSLREVLDANRHHVQQVVGHAQTQAESCKKEIDRERSLRTSLEEKNRVVEQTINERMDETVQRVHRSMQELQNGFQQHAAEMGNAVDMHHQKTLGLKSSLESAHQEGACRVNSLGERIYILEQRAAEGKEEQNGAVERLSQRFEKMNQNLEAMKSGISNNAFNVQQVGTKLAALEDSIVNGRSELHDLIGNERRQRGEEMRAFKNVASSEHASKYSQLEHKFEARLERESASRQDAASGVGATSVERSKFESSRPTMLSSVKAVSSVPEVGSPIGSWRQKRPSLPLPEGHRNFIANAASVQAAASATVLASAQSVDSSRRAISPYPGSKSPLLTPRSQPVGGSFQVPISSGLVSHSFSTSPIHMRPSTSTTILTGGGSASMESARSSRPTYTIPQSLIVPNSARCLLR